MIKCTVKGSNHCAEFDALYYFNWLCITFVQILHTNIISRKKQSQDGHYERDLFTFSKVEQRDNRQGLKTEVSPLYNKSFCVPIIDLVKLKLCCA